MSDLLQRGPPLAYSGHHISGAGYDVRSLPLKSFSHHLSPSPIVCVSFYPTLHLPIPTSVPPSNTRDMRSNTGKMPSNAAKKTSNSRSTQGKPVGGGNESAQHPRAPSLLAHVLHKKEIKQSWMMRMILRVMRYVYCGIGGLI